LKAIVSTVQSQYSLGEATRRCYIAAAGSSNSW